jgi:CheY-like chemotaxis protein
VYNPPDDSHPEKDILLLTETLEPNTSSLKGLKVLVVDDNEDCQVLLSVIFQEYQAEAKIAGSVDEAIEIMEEWQSDVLISDIYMGEKDGYSLIHSIREKEKLEGTFLPAIAFTAYAENRVEALEAGFQDVILKPFEPDELVAQVAKLSLTTIKKSKNQTKIDKSVKHPK